MCRGVLEELNSVVTRARMFQFKPDGEVTFRMAQDAHGLPAPVMQDPLHYPHNTGYLAPGATHLPNAVPSVRSPHSALPPPDGPPL